MLQKKVISRLDQSDIFYVYLPIIYILSFRGKENKIFYAFWICLFYRLANNLFPPLISNKDTRNDVEKLQPRKRATRELHGDSIARFIRWGAAK